MSDSLARALAAPAPAAQPMGNQDMLARILMGNPDPRLPQYPVMQSAEGRGFAPLPTSMGDMGARMGAVLRGQVEPTPGERYGMDVPLGWVAGSGGSARDGIRAYHGSPYQFDRFDMSRIGTGEGAQAYGHGLYFSGSEGVARGYKGKDGGLYEVRLNTHPEELIDWNKPFERQSPRVQASMSDVFGKENLAGSLDKSIGHRLGALSYNRFGGMNDAAASSALREAGIPGVVYHEPGSLASLGNGPRNYVMFDDKLIDILRRYGLAGMLAGGAASQAQAGETAP